jgi:hypothetical protein
MHLGILLVKSWIAYVFIYSYMLNLCCQRKLDKRTVTKVSMITAEKTKPESFVLIHILPSRFLLA